MKRGRSLVITSILSLLMPMLALTVANAQEYVLQQTLETDAVQFATDKLQNIYLVNAKNKIIKLDKTVNQQYLYSNNRLGELTYIDATNPFKLLLFYPDFGNIVVLDRTLTENGSFNLFDLNLLQVNAVGTASDNGIWLYDPLNFKLKKINQRGDVIVQSADMSLTLNTQLQPNFVVEKEQRVYLNDPEVGILVFDLFGQYLKTIQRKGLDDFQIIDGRCIYYDQEALYAFNLQSLISEPIQTPLPRTDFKQLSVQKNKLYLLQDGKLLMYGF